MQRLLLVLFLVAALAAVVVIRLRVRGVDEPRPTRIPAGELTPVCPWRDSQRDLAQLFPGATGTVVESRIVSSVIAPLRKQLGRMPTPDENPLRIYRARNEQATLGSILVRRGKGEHGGIEMVVAFDNQRAIGGVLIQSQREPDDIAAVITNRAWLSSFNHKMATSAFRLGEDLPEVPMEARASALAVAESVRSAAIVLDFAEKPLENGSLPAHTHP